MSIGDALAAARRHAGLTVTQVSQRTCIRETIIRGIERDDFSACGGDFYARGHIRSVARVVGAEPEPLIREYDATQGSPEGITAADVFEPSTPIRLKERHRPNWSLALALALAVIVGVTVYHALSGPTRTSPAASTHPSSGSAAPAARHARAKPKQKTAPARARSAPVAADPHHLVIDLTTVSSDCWVDLTSASGDQTIFEGTLPLGTSKSWTADGPVSMEIGDPGAVNLTVNGVSQSTPAGSPVTLTLGASQTPQTQQ